MGLLGRRSGQEEGPAGINTDGASGGTRKQCSTHTRGEVGVAGGCAVACCDFLLPRQPCSEHILLATNFPHHTTPQHTQLLLLSRAFVGFGLAGAPVAFTLLMEMLPPASRAVWGVGIELAWTVGTIAEAALAWAVLNTQGWRLLLLLSTGPLGRTLGGVLVALCTSNQTAATWHLRTQLACAIA